MDALTLGGTISVNTRFLVFNEVNYPNLVALFNVLNVKIEPNAIHFAASYGDSAIEYGSRTLDDAFGQRNNIVSPRFWKIIRYIRRFYADTPLILKDREPFRRVTFFHYHWQVRLPNFSTFIPFYMCFYEP